MKIYSVYDSEFAPYGRVMEGYDTAALCRAMRRFPLPESGTAYEPSLLELESAGLYSALRDSAFGGMPVQIGMCWGRNTRLNCLEYHRDSELNVGEGDFILLLARRDELGSGFTLDTGKVKAFRVPAGALVEVYATTLHYAPCHVDASEGFRVAVVLPRGTNGPRPAFAAASPEDVLLRARNKWLIAHPESAEAADGAFAGLTGENIDISADI